MRRKCFLPGGAMSDHRCFVCAISAMVSFVIDPAPEETKHRVDAPPWARQQQGRHFA